MKIVAWLILLSAPLLVGGAEAPIRLKTDELKALLVGKDLEALPNTTKPYGIERLKPTGYWCEEAHRTYFLGTYRIADDMLCVARAGHPEFCRMFFRDKNGRIFARNVPAAENPGALREYDVRPIQTPMC